MFALVGEVSHSPDNNVLFRPPEGRALLVSRFLLAAACGLLWFGTDAAADPSSKAAAEIAIAAATAAQQTAAAVGGEWRDTGKLIDKAKRAAAAGDYDTALGWAKKAEAQGKLGKAQAMGQMGVGNPAYLYD